MAHESTIIFGLIEQALRQPADDRRSFIEKACQGQPELLAEVLGMLDVVERDVLEAATMPSPPPAPPAQSQFGGPAAEESAAPSPYDDFELQARQCAEPRSEADGGGYWIGPYKLMALLGEGGFGAVFLAERRQPVRFRVALKVIRPGMDTRQVLARFEQERHVLAMMDHPGIARVVDAGTTAAGRPFFAMEYVPGKPVTRYCDEHRLSIADRLEVFSMVCQAVQHAHDRGVIHRDLKPGNILVREIDNKAVVKVIDFGIAKATLHLQSAQDIFTREGILIGTPEYMSPEQADKDARDIDTRTDVFSLGVILYELLAGTLPIASDTLREAQIYEAYRIIREQERPRASTRLSELDKLSPADMEVARSRARERGQASPDQAASEMLSKKRADAERVARERQIGIEDLRRRLRRELDWILQRTLELPRNRRYDSPRALAEDIGRYLRGEAIKARPASLGYTTRKFIRKHRLAVGTAATVLAAILIGAGVAVWKWQDEKAARREADTQYRFASQLNSFLIDDLLGSPDPDEDGVDVTVKTVLDRASERVDESLKDLPQVRTAVLAAIGSAYLQIGDAASAGRELKSASDLAASVPVSRELRQRIQTDLTEALYRERSDDAVGAIEPLIKAHDTAGEPEDEAFAEELCRLAAAYKWDDKLDQSRATYQRAMSIQSRLLGPSHSATITTRYDLLLVDLAEAVSLRRGKRDFQAHEKLDAAIPRVRTLIAESATSLGEEHSVTLMIRSEEPRFVYESARPFDDQPLDDDRMREADRLYTQIIPKLESKLGPRHWRTIEAINNHANVIDGLGRTDDYSRVCGDLYARYRVVRGVCFSDTLTLGRRWARALERTGCPECASRIIDTLWLDTATCGDDVERNKVATFALEFFTRTGDEARKALWRTRSEAKPDK